MKFEDLSKKLFGPIGALIGFVTTIVSFVVLMRTNLYLGVTILAAILWLVAFSSLLYVIMAKEIPKLSLPNQRPKPILKYPKFRRWAFVGELLLVFLIIGLARLHPVQLFVKYAFTAAPSLSLEQLVACSRNQEATIILVADFDGPDPQSYGVTETLLSELSGQLAETSEALVLPMRRTILQQQGSVYARRVGEECGASLVLWGWYRVTDTDVIVDTHVETFKTLQSSFLSKNNGNYQIQTPIEELNSFTLQTRLSQEIAGLMVYLNGLVASDQGNEEKAITLFSQAIDSEAWANNLLSKAVVFRSRGETYLSQGSDFLGQLDEKQAKENLSRAIEDFTQAVTLDPQDITAYLLRGMSYAANDEPDKAIEDYSQAIALEPTFIFTYIFRGQVYLDKGDLDQAIENYDQAITIAPEDPNAYVSRGIAYEKRDNYSQAIKDFDRAIVLSPEYASAYYNRGLAYKIRGNLAQAIEDLSRTIELDPQFEFAYLNRGFAYEKLGELDRAIKDFSKLIAIDPRFPFIYQIRGLAYDEKGDLDKAIEDYSQSILLDGPTARGTTYHLRGLLYLEKDDYDNAIKDFTQAIALDLQNPSLYNNRGNAYFKKEDFDLAIEDFNQAIMLDPQYAIAFFNRGHAYANKQLQDEAVADLKQYLELAPDAPNRAEVEAQITELEK